MSKRIVHFAGKWRFFMVMKDDLIREFQVL